MLCNTLKSIMSPIVSIRRLVSCSILSLTLMALLLAGCGQSTVSTPTPPAIPPASANSQDASTAPLVAATATSNGYQVKVYFSRFPDSLSNSAATFPVDRISPTRSVGTFAIQLLIAGPTPEERTAGYFSELNSRLSGPSSCSGSHPTGGPDFMLNISGSTATVKFCRSLSSPGIGTDARVSSEVNATLKQFSSITKVIILTKDGHCFGDESGRDQCLK
ncbi:MAG: hypothetical protein M3Y81_27535 [Chloroflexota bacterium]|nr:hypothetical protein [Chloroflexota bacterium]